MLVPVLELAVNSELVRICWISGIVLGSERYFQRSCGFDKESRMFVDITSGYLLLIEWWEKVSYIPHLLTGVSLEFTARTWKITATMWLQSVSY